MYLHVSSKIMSFLVINSGILAFLFSKNIYIYRVYEFNLVQIFHAFV